MTASDIHRSGVGRISDAVTSGRVREAIAGASEALAAVGIEMPRLDAELLLADAIGCDRARIAAEPEVGVPAPAARRFGEMVRRRLRREPVAYVLGRKGFRHLELEVDRRVLIPRPETEMLVELALELRPARLLDVGTGSGAIALAVADELPECEVVATDTSPAALEVARANAERLGLAERVRFLEGSLPPGGARLSTSGLQTRPAGFDLVLANLPYVAERDWSSLQPEVTQWEPREALLGGRDGLDAYRAFIPECSLLLSRYAKQRMGALAVEVGEGQAEAVAELFRQADFAGIETRRDLAGIERVVLGRVGEAG
ncbi:MAG TPA: peptide chain release factor N(5)-glutamine methyltransferase [Solirubrobacterales bacterium]|nr:peptide chain release factor N(5)-glutamine methyltransferase [Solirubrobacterales bacterium]